MIKCTIWNLPIQVCNSVALSVSCCFYSTHPLFFFRLIPYSSDCFHYSTRGLYLLWKWVRSLNQSESQGADEAPTFQRKRTATTCCLLTIPMGIWYFYLLNLAFPGEVSVASWWQQWSSGYLRGRPGLGSWLLDSVWSSSSCRRHLRCNPAGGSSLSASPILS